MSDLERCLNALYLVVDEQVADDVNAKVRAALAERIDQILEKNIEIDQLKNAWESSAKASHVLAEDCVKAEKYALKLKKALERIIEDPELSCVKCKKYSCAEVAKEALRDH